MTFLLNLVKDWMLKICIRKNTFIIGSLKLQLFSINDLVCRIVKFGLMAANNATEDKILVSIRTCFNIIANIQQ